MRPNTFSEFIKKSLVLQSNRENRDHHKYFWNVIVLKEKSKSGLVKFRVCSFDESNNGLLIRDLLDKFRDRKGREIRNWICNLGSPSQTGAIVAASQEMTCFLIFDKLCDYTMQNFVAGSSNSDDGT